MIWGGPTIIVPPACALCIVKGKSPKYNDELGKTSTNANADTITHGMWSIAAARKYVEVIVAQGKPERIIA